MNNQEAINSLNNIVEYWSCRPTEIEAAKLAISALEAQQADRWIPVTERLPSMEECQKNDCRFIVTDGNRRYQAWFDYEYRHFCKCECNGLGLKNDNCVRAWRPFPESYKEEQP